MGMSITRRAAIKQALKAGTYAAPVVLAATVPVAVAAASPVSSADLFVSIGVPAGGGGGIFILVAANAGPSTASNVVVTITHDVTLVFVGTPVASQGTYNPVTGIWTVGTVTTTGPFPSLTIPYTGPGIIRVTITSSTPDPNPANNTTSQAG
jgi:hypothetical protein